MQKQIRNLFREFYDIAFDMFYSKPVSRFVFVLSAVSLGTYCRFSYQILATEGRKVNKRVGMKID